MKHKDGLLTITDTCTAIDCVAYTVSKGCKTTLSGDKTQRCECRISQCLVLLFSESFRSCVTRRCAFICHYVYILPTWGVGFFRNDRNFQNLCVLSLIYKANAIFGFSISNVTCNFHCWRA